MKKKPLVHYKSYHYPDDSIWSHLCGDRRDWNGDDENATCCSEDFKKVTCKSCNKEFDRITKKADKCL